MSNWNGPVQSTKIQTKLIDVLSDLNDKFGVDLGSAITTDCLLVGHLIWRSDRIGLRMSLNGEDIELSRLCRFLRDTWIEMSNGETPAYEDYVDNFDLKDFDIKNTRSFESYYLAYLETPERRIQIIELIDEFFFSFYEAIIGILPFNPMSPEEFFSNIGVRDFDYPSEINANKHRPSKSSDELLREFGLQIDPKLN